MLMVLEGDAESQFWHIESDASRHLKRSRTVEGKRGRRREEWIRFAVSEAIHVRVGFKKLSMRGRVKRNRNRGKRKENRGAQCRR